MQTDRQSSLTFSSDMCWHIQQQQQTDFQLLPRRSSFHYYVLLSILLSSRDINMLVDSHLHIKAIT